MINSQTRHSGRHLREPKSTTIKDPGTQVFEDLVNRDFTAHAPGRFFVSDIAYLPYGTEGGSYIWRPCWMCVRGVRWVGRSRITCVPSWSWRR